MQHRITIGAAGRPDLYRVTGDVELVSAEPVIASARELLARGSSPSDSLRVDAGGDCNVVPMSLESILRHRPTPNRHAALREMLGIPPR